MTLLTLAYWTVLVSELIGDRNVYSIAALAARYRPASIVAGLSVAFMLKTLVAVLIAQTLQNLPASWCAAISAVVFLVTAIFLWRERPSSEPSGADPARRESAALVAFSSVFFSEWADPGQLAVAALTTHSHEPFTVWLAGTLALVTKGSMAVMLGTRLRRWIPARLTRALAVTTCLVLAVTAIVER